MAAQDDSTGAGRRLGDDVVGVHGLGTSLDVEADSDSLGTQKVRQREAVLTRDADCWNAAFVSHLAEERAGFIVVDDYPGGAGGGRVGDLLSECDLAAF